MIIQRKEHEIELIRESALMVSAVLAEMAKMIRPGITTDALDARAEEFILDHGGKPSFKGYGPTNNPYPCAIITSVNEVVVHGIPGKYEIKDGDVVSVDCGFYRNGYHGDHAYTFGVGNVRPEVVALMRIAKESLFKGIAQARANNRIGDIAWAIENHTHGLHGYGVVRELVGHGVGQDLHEDPQVPNFGKRGEGKRLKENMVIAIEPMINLGVKEVMTMDDGWTVISADGQPSVHYEHTVVVRKNSGEALSSFAPIEEAERNNPELSTAHLVEVMAEA